MELAAAYVDMTNAVSVLLQIYNDVKVDALHIQQKNDINTAMETIVQLKT